MQEKLQKSVELLEQFKTNALPSGITDGQLWEAQKIKQVNERLAKLPIFSRNIKFALEVTQLQVGSS